MDELEKIWSGLLSGEPEQIATTWKALSSEEAQAVKAHLQRMIEDVDYSEIQKESARQALVVIESHA
jgi:hypothetical protein